MSSPLVESINAKFAQTEKVLIEAFETIKTRFNGFDDNINRLELKIFELTETVAAQDKLIKELQDSRADGILLKDPVE